MRSWCARTRETIHAMTGNPKIQVTAMAATMLSSIGLECSVGQNVNRSVVGGQRHAAGARAETDRALRGIVVVARLSVNGDSAAVRRGVDREVCAPCEAHANRTIVGLHR